MVCLGFDFLDFPVAGLPIHDPDIDGLIGLDLLRELRIGLHVRNGIVVTARA